MSFRLRVVLLVTFIAVTATAMTAWLTLHQASQELTRSIAANREQVAAITGGLADYGRVHGTWHGVPAAVRSLNARTGQRVRVTTDAGDLLADSDILAGRAARPTAGPPVQVEARLPTLRIPPEYDAGARIQVAAALVVQYHSGWTFAACLTRAGARVQTRTVPGKYGPLPEFLADGAARPLVARCRTEADRVYEHPPDLASADRVCGTVRDLARSSACLERKMAEQIREFAPSRLEVFIGAKNAAPPRLSGGSVGLAALIVALVAAAAALLLSRRVLRPIGALTLASRRVAAGDLTGRVAVDGRDELADLGRTFNRMADFLQQSEDRQRRMVADVAHELRSPLANLRGYLEALKDGVLPPSPQLFTSLHEEALLQQRIVEDLQDLAQAEAGVLAYHKTRLDLVELAGTCRIAHAALAESAGVRLVVNGKGRVCVDADPDRLRQVLGNLLRNAVAATEPGGSVTVDVAGTAGSSTVTVTDTGAGMAAEDLEHVFDRFWRADRARARTTGGSGLGLAIARQIVADHGGSIAVASELRAGTTFAIVLPACGAHRAGPADIR